MNKTPVGLNESFGSLVEPLTRANQFVVSQVEKAVTLSLDSLRAYVDLGMAQIKVALKVDNSQGLHEFADSQFAVLSFVGHRMLDDGRAMNEWGMEGCHQAHRLARKSMLRLLFKY